MGTCVPVFLSRGIIPTSFLPNPFLHTTQDNGIRLPLNTRVKNCPISDPSKPWPIVNASFYLLIVPIDVSSHGLLLTRTADVGCVLVHAEPWKCLDTTIHLQLIHIESVHIDMGVLQGILYFFYVFPKFFEY